MHKTIILTKSISFQSLCRSAVWGICKGQASRASRPRASDHHHRTPNLAEGAEPSLTPQAARGMPGRRKRQRERALASVDDIGPGEGRRTPMMEELGNDGSSSTRMTRRRRRRGRGGGGYGLSLPAAALAMLCLLAVALLFSSLPCAQAKRPPADSISVRIRPKREGGNGAGAGGGAAKGRGDGAGGATAAGAAGAAAVNGASARGPRAGVGSAASSGEGLPPQQDLLGKLTSLAWRSPPIAPARRFAWRKLHITKNYLILESRLGPDVFAIPRAAVAGRGEVKVQRHPKAAMSTLLTPAASPVAGSKQQKPQASSAAAETLSIDGVFGFFDLPSGPYLAVITDSEDRYRGHGMEFRLVTKVTLVRVSNSTEPAAAAATPSGAAAGQGSGASASTSKPSTAMLLGEEEAEEDEDERQLDLLRMAFRAHDLYFSTTSDVTLSAQRRATLDAHPHPPASTGGGYRPRLQPLWQRADERFFWNKHLLGPLMEAGAHDWVLPVMSAHVQAARNVSLHGKHAGGKASKDSVGTLLLVSRRSCLRQGRRFVKRGIDAEGHTANFVETEQLFIHRDGSLTSLVQIRGSIPLFWASPANLKYTPKVHLERSLLENTVAMGRHYDDLLRRYSYSGSGGAGRDAAGQGGGGPIVLINLIDRKKDQGRLGRALDTVHHLVTGALAHLPPEAAVADAASNNHHHRSSGGFLSDLVAAVRSRATGGRGKRYPPGARVSLTWFDFHAECKHMRWDRLRLLLDQLGEELAAQGFFHADGQGRVRSLQRGVMRTNCMDCLDRTNVVQSIIGRWSLARQLEHALGIPGATGGTVLQLPFDGIERPFRHLWSGNADAISVLYAGTPALKGDFTRTGRRTRRGALQDGIHSIKRYVINNFVDELNQQAVEALLGRAGPATGAAEGFTVLPESGTGGLSPRQLEVWREALWHGGGAPVEGVSVDVERDLDRPLAELVPPATKAEAAGSGGGKGLVIEEEEDDDEEEEQVAEYYGDDDDEEEEDDAGEYEVYGDEDDGYGDDYDDDDQDDDGAAEALRAAADAAQGLL